MNRSNYNDFSELSFIILAGGRSSRMQFNKIFIELRGEKLLNYIVNVVSKFTRNIVIAIGHNDSKEDFAELLPEWVRIEKDVQEKKAAAFGIMTGLRNIQTEYAAVIASDIPFINIDVIKYLFQEAKGFNLAIPYWENGDIEPLYAVYKVSETLRILEENLRDKKIRIKDSIERLGKVKYIPVEEIRNIDKTLNCFLNINTQEDLNKVQEILKKKDS